MCVYRKILKGLITKTPVNGLDIVKIVDKCRLYERQECGI